jgi:predicted nucleotidyltransferase
MKPGGVLRIGQDPLRFDLINHIEGVDFAECFSRRAETRIDGVSIPIIGLDDLKANKKATGRNKDLADLDYLP